MFSYILILSVIVIIVILTFLFRYNKNNFFESFGNYTQIPNFKPIIGREVNTYLPSNFKISKEFYSPNLEMTNSQMNNILDKVIDKSKIKKYKNLKFKQLQDFKYDYYSGFSGNKIDYSKINDYLKIVMNRINEIIIRENKLSTKINSTVSGELISSNYLHFLFLLIDFQIIKYSRHNDILNIELLFDIYRLGKYSAFQIYIRIVIDQNEVYIIQSYVSGNINEDRLKISPFQNKNNVEIYKKFPYYQPNINTQNGYLFDSNEEKKITMSANEQIKYLYKMFDKKQNKLFDFSYKCFGSIGDDMYQCLSNKNINGQKKNKGIWDRPCLINSECPFYKANKNTDNEFGGCIKGSCQMPLGITKVGYHFYTDLDKSICYNCIDSQNCCLEQLDRSKYSKLKSPDYAFSNDNRLF